MILQHLLFTLTLLLPIHLTAAQFTSTTTTSQTKPTPLSHPPNSKYIYHGCYNETTGVDGTGGARALADGINQVRKGEMTVPLCLAFCGDQKGQTEYTYAGLEFSRECWCSNHISGASVKMDEADCSLPCDGNGTLACGGAERLSVYMIGSAASTRIAYGVGTAALVGTMVFNLL